MTVTKGTFVVIFAVILEATFLAIVLQKLYTEPMPPPIDSLAVNPQFIIKSEVTSQVPAAETVRYFLDHWERPIVYSPNGKIVSVEVELDYNLNGGFIPGYMSMGDPNELFLTFTIGDKQVHSEATANDLGELDGPANFRQSLFVRAIQDALAQLKDIK